MVTNFITAKLPSEFNSFIVYIIPFSKKDLMWYAIKRHKKGQHMAGGNEEIKIIHDLGKGEGRYTNIQVEVYFTNENYI